MRYVLRLGSDAGHRRHDHGDQQHEDVRGGDDGTTTTRATGEKHGDLTAERTLTRTHNGGDGDDRVCKTRAKRSNGKHKTKRTRFRCVDAAANGKKKIKSADRGNG